MFDAGKNLPVRSGVAGILHLDRHCHVSRIVQSDRQLVLERPVNQSIPAWSILHKFSLKCGGAWQQEISDEYFLWNRFCEGQSGGERWEKGKGCDIGYALAISSCEGANNVEARTVTALDAITTFAVPNPNCPSQSRRFFQVWLLLGLPR
jgi:hypothetical protein